MASADASQARQKRIINHVNKDHKEALSHYLQHFAKVPAAAAFPPTSPPELLEVDLDQMLVRAGDGQQHIIPFTPPLSAWDEMRSRFVEMDATARDALYDVVVTEYAPPRGAGAAVLGAILFYFSCYVGLPWIVPGSAPGQLVEAVFPGGIASFRWIVKAIFWPVILIHSTEAILFDRTRAAKHGIPRWSKLWWLWEVNCWFEGFTCWKRIDAIVEEKRAAKAQKAE